MGLKITHILVLIFSLFFGLPAKFLYQFLELTQEASRNRGEQAALMKPSKHSFRQSGLGTTFGRQMLILYCVFLLKVARPTISPQSGEGNMHEVPRLRTKVVRDIPAFTRLRLKARTTKTARTPIAKAI